MKLINCSMITNIFPFVSSVLVLSLILQFFFGPVSESPDIRHKYFNKSFIKTDLDKNIFDIEELSRHIFRRWYAYNDKKINFIKTGMNIVNDNDNFSLIVLDETISHNMGDIVYINDTKHSCNHKIDYICCHHGSVFDMTIMCTNKKYRFHDLSQIELYFDSRKLKSN